MNRKRTQRRKSKIDIENYETERAAKINRPSSPIVRIYQHNSLVNGKRLRAEGENEYAFLMEASFDPKIIDIETDLDSIILENGRRYTPDVRTITEGYELMNFEIKNDESAGKPEVIEKYDYIQQQFQGHEMNFTFLRATDFRNFDRLQNLKRMLVVVTGPQIPKGELQQAEMELKSIGTTEFGDYIDRLIKKGLNATHFWLLLYEKKVKVDIDIFISEQTLIGPTDDEN